MDGYLKARTPPSTVQRWGLRAAIQYVDIEGVMARRSVKTKRGQYSVPSLHYLWHIDWNHKVIKWETVINGGMN